MDASDDLIDDVNDAIDDVPSMDAPEAKPKFLVCEDDAEFSIRDRCLLESCVEWFNADRERTSQLLDILSKKAGVSLRLVDWTVTNYCKTHTIVVTNQGFPVDVFVDYRRRLNAHTKRNFDAFARRKRIVLVFFGTTRRQSSLAQLNFFKYVIHRNIFQYCADHREEIESHMKETEARRKKTEGRSVEPHKTALVKCAPQMFSGKFHMEF